LPQLTLFDASETLLADDERGRMAYTPGFVDAATADAWFTELRTGVKWRAERRMMYEREVDVPRLIGHFRLDSAPGLAPEAIRDAARRVVDSIGVPFNSVGLNLHARDPQDDRAGGGAHQPGVPREASPRSAGRRCRTRFLSLSEPEEVRPKGLHHL